MPSMMRIRNSWSTVTGIIWMACTWKSYMTMMLSSLCVLDCSVAWMVTCVVRCWVLGVGYARIIMSRT